MEIKKRQSIGPELVFDLYDNLTAQNRAIRAFGALLEGADLESRFGNSSPDGMDYRAGLNQIVELYIEHQERKLEEVRQQCLTSPDWIIKTALHTYKMIQNGGYRTNEIALQECRKSIGQVALVIAEYGAEQCPDAVQAREKLLDLQSVIVGNMGSEKIKTASVKKGKVVAVDWQGIGPGDGKVATA